MNIGANIHDEMCEIANFVVNIGANIWRNSRLVAHLIVYFGCEFILSTYAVFLTRT